MKIIKAFMAVGSLTFVSRIFGFVRDVLMARYLGAGAGADSFFIAFKLPNFFRRIFAEGAFSAGFVPLFAKALGSGADRNEAKAHAVASAIFAWFLPVLVLFLVAIELAMVPVIQGLTGGFDGDSAKFAQTVDLGRLIFPYLLFISLAAFLSATLNAYGRFSAAAFSPVILNIFMIAALGIWGESPEGAHYLAVAVSLSGVAQVVWLYGAAYRAGLRLKPQWPQRGPEIAKLVTLVAPAALGAGVIQLNLLVDVILAARFLDDGAVSWLFYADRLNQLPVGVIGVAIGTVILPLMTQQLTAGEEEKADRTQNQAIMFGMMATIPAAAALFLIPEILIGTLFERDAFTGDDTLRTAAALKAFAVGLPAYILIKIFTPGFHARQDTKTPVRIAVAAMLVNIAANLALIGPYGHVGLAAGTAISAWFSAAYLYVQLRRRGWFRLSGLTVSRLGRIMLASAGMGFILVETNTLFGATIQSAVGPIGLLTALVMSGLLGYGLLALCFGALQRTDIANLRRRQNQA